MNQIQLTELIAASGNCVNLGRSMKAKSPALHDWVLDSTQFIPATAKFTERLFCITNNISSQVQNEDGTQSKFVNMFRGYSIKPLPVQKLPLKGRPPKRTNLQNYITRNGKRNKHLYAASAVLGVDYVVCPATDTRKSMIEAKYINTVLEMTVEQYDQLYPNIQKVCTARIGNIKKGVNIIDDATGLTKHQISVEKSKVALSQLDESGQSGYDRKGQKTKATHMANVDELGRNGYSRIASKAIIKGNATKVTKGLILDISVRSEFYRYKSVVTYQLSRKTTSLQGVDVRRIIFLYFFIYL